MMRLLIPILVAMAFAVPPAAAHCEMTTSDPEIDTGDHENVPRFYVVNDDCPECWSI